jgi:hypothetical protein
MKRVAIMLLALGALTAYGQPGSRNQAFESRAATMLNMQRYLSSLEIKPNEIVSGNVHYSGIAVEALKTGHPLQLINPLAPAKYGSPENNVLRDGITKRVLGWKIFSIGF